VPDLDALPRCPGAPGHGPAAHRAGRLPATRQRQRHAGRRHPGASPRRPHTAPGPRRPHRRRGPRPTDGRRGRGCRRRRGRRQERRRVRSVCAPAHGSLAPGGTPHAGRPDPGRPRHGPGRRPERRLAPAGPVRGRPAHRSRPGRGRRGRRDRRTRAPARHLQRGRPGPARHGPPDRRWPLGGDRPGRRPLRRGGLTGLVRAADDACDGAGGHELRRATCIAVAPDLLGTVSQIAGGTSVVIDRDADPSAAGGRSGGGRDPQGVDGEQVASDAARWIDELQALTDGGCVVSLPGAQADLDSVARVGEPSLTSVATDSDTVERVLGVETVPDVLVPASGTLDPATPAALGAGGSTALVADRSTRTDTGLLPPPGLVETTGPERTRALTYSSTLGASLAATGDVPENPRYSDPATRYWLTADSPEARLQDARAALLAPIIDEADRARAAPGQQPGAAAGARLPAVGAATPDPSEAGEQGILAVPPQVWSVDGSVAGSLLDLLGAQLESDRLRAVSLPERLAGPVTTPDGALAEDPTGASDPGQTDPFGADPGGTTEQRLAETLAGIGTLRSLVDTSDPTSALAPAHLDPMVGDALRVLSESGR